MKFQDKAELIARMGMVQTALAKQGVKARLTGLDADSFWFQIPEGTDLAEMLVALYEKWPDLIATYINVKPEGWFLICQFVVEMQVGEGHEHAPYAGTD